MKRLHILVLGLFIMLLSAKPAENLTQTVRGTIYDIDSRTPLIGANIYVQNSNPILGAVTDLDGNFRIEKVPVGRVNLIVSSIGYEQKTLANILIASAKETVLDIELQESVIKLEEAIVTVRQNKSEVLNSMATVSSKTFSVEETNRYAGSLNDPARMVAAYAGVSSSPEGNNDIVVRGNSPKNILWRLEGIEIPNPNHFGENGNTGGPVSILNPAMLANSDFFSGAFAPEYGNALSGVFDVNFRKGNNEKREYSFSIGVLGTEIAAEGPFSKNYNGSYLVNYRYSSLDLLTKAGVLDFGGIPKYQDASFKFELPTKRMGRFSIFGLGGISSIASNDEDDDGFIYGTYYLDANLGVLGVNHSYIINERNFVKSYVLASSAESRVSDDRLDDENIMFSSFKNSFREGTLRASSAFHHKFDSRTKCETGFIISGLSYNMWEVYDAHNTGENTMLIDAHGSTSLIQAYTSWKYRMHKNLTAIGGLHYTQLYLNNNNSIEPRFGLKWQFFQKQNLSFGFGVHSKVENISTYMASSKEGDTYYRPNLNLELTKALHYVLGYGYLINPNLHFKTELYFQYLYDVPIENIPTSTYSILNTSGGYSTRELVNKGTGKNYGLELTLERFFSNNLYYLVTTSLYKSKYTAMDGIERNTRYDANYAGNILFGKEFKVGKAGKNKTIGINTKACLLGAQRYTPIDLEASIEAGYEKNYEGRPYSMKGEDVFILNLGITYRVNRKNTTHELKLDITNLTNNQAIVTEYYNTSRQIIQTGEQMPFVPNILYTIKF